MPPPFPRPLLPLTLYRLFHLSARLRLRHSPTRLADDYYALLLSAPLPAPAKRIRIGWDGGGDGGRVKGDREGGKDGEGVDTAGLSGKKERVMRTGRRIERPKEPENCCMSGCVHCVWDAYREEVEGWVAGRKGGDGGMDVRDGDGDGGVEGSVESVLEGVPVGIRAFMDMEKRLGERRGKRGEG
jgi:hypothetical protein